MMSEDYRYKPPAEEPPPVAGPATGQGPAIPIHRYILDAWADLLGPRKRILRRAYARSIRNLDPDATEPATLDEARRRLVLLQQEPVTSEFMSDMHESKFVIVSKIVAAWVVFWSTILPAAVVAWLCLSPISRMRDPNWANFVLVAIGIVVLFPTFSIFGVILLSALMRPFHAVLGKFFSASTRAKS